MRKGVNGARTDIGYKITDIGYKITKHSCTMYIVQKQLYLNKAGLAVDVKADVLFSLAVGRVQLTDHLIRLTC